MKNLEKLHIIQKLRKTGVFKWNKNNSTIYISQEVFEFFFDGENSNEENLYEIDSESTSVQTLKEIIDKATFHTSSEYSDNVTVPIKVNDVRYIQIVVNYSKEEEIYNGIVYDNTSEMNYKREVEFTNERLDYVFDKAPFPIMIHNQNGDMLYMNKEVERQSGYSKEEVPNLKTWVDLVHPGRIEYNSEFIKRNFDAGEILVQGESEIVVTKDKEERVWEFYNSILSSFDSTKKSMLTICVDVTETARQKEQREKLIEELHDTKLFFEASLNSLSNMVILSIDKNLNYIFFNEQHRQTMKDLYHQDVVVGENILKYITNEEDKVKEKIKYERALKGEPFTSLESYGDDKLEYFETFYHPIKDEFDEVRGVIIFTSNVTKRVEELEQIKLSEEKFRNIYSSMSQSLAVHEIITDDKGKPIDYVVLDINRSYEKLFGYVKEEVIGKRIKEIAPKIDQYWIDTFGEVALTQEPKYYENYSTQADKYFSTYAYSPKKGQFAVLISDITERVEHEREIRYLSYNDQLTGVYNRRYYEEKIIELDTKDNLPLSMIMGDVNGLKLVNDSFGHLVGDELLKKVATIFKKACRNNDVITRIGGDEFVIILPRTSFESAEKIINRINKLAEKETVESINVSISFGLGTKVNKEESLVEIFKKIEDEMYKNKLVQGTSMRSKTIDLIMQTLYEKNEREMTHSKRVSTISEMLASTVSKDKEFVNQVRLAGLMHDIGKIGIDEQILNKTGPLNKEEWKQVKRHSEVGYRILSSINEFSDIAKFVLEHHERVNGTGYPRSLKKEEISIQARIIAIADAFDAMTGPRSYKESLSSQEALDELVRCSGTDFDAELVQTFITSVYPKILRE